MAVDIKEQYDSYKKIKGGSVMMDRLLKQMFPTIYYWDNSSSSIMLEVDLSNYTAENLNTRIETLKKVHNIFKQGYIDKDDVDRETFRLLQEHVLNSAYRYSLIKRRPFILLQIKYNKLSEEEIRCIFEYIIHTDLYLNAIKHKDIVVFVKLGWWVLKDMINKYKGLVRSGMDDYSYEGENRW